MLTQVFNIPQLFVLFVYHLFIDWDKNTPLKLWADQDLYVHTPIHAAEYI